MTIDPIDTDELARAIELLEDAGAHVNRLRAETTTKGAALLLGWEVATIHNKRSAGAPLPRCYLFGRELRFRIVDVLEFRDRRAESVRE